MLNQSIENIVNFVRETRDEADCLGEHILFFFTFLMLAIGVGFIGFSVVALAFTIPKVFIPIYLSIFILWQGYKRL